MVKLTMINLVLSEMQFTDADCSILDLPLQTCIDHTVLRYNIQQLVPPFRAVIIVFARNFEYSDSAMTSCRITIENRTVCAWHRQKT